MKVTYIGHACFKLEERGYSIVIDPYTDEYIPGLANVREEANEVHFSHEHKDHMSTNTVTIIQNDATPFKITKIVSFHDDVMGQKRGANIIHLVESTDIFGNKTRVAHLGDLGCVLTDAQLESLKDLDVLMIPVGGTYTIDAAEALELTEVLGARMTIPMHYYSKEGEYGLDTLGTVYQYAAFAKNVMMTSTSTVDTHEGFRDAVIVLQPQNQIKDLTQLRLR